MKTQTLFRPPLVFAACLIILLPSFPFAAPLRLLNASFDPTRELYAEIHDAFSRHWSAKGGADLSLLLSNGGSGKQARAVLEGLPADVVTLALASDVDAIAEKSGLISMNWRNEYPNGGVPFTSTVVFLVRSGNPKRIRDWEDLIRPGLSLITPNPKTSGGGRWNFLAAWGQVLKRGGTDTEAFDFTTRFFKNAPILDAGARGSTTTFVERGLGDVLVTWESEARLALERMGDDRFEIVIPPTSILAEPPVALVKANAIKHGTLEAAQEYLTFLYTPEGQAIAAKHHYRPWKSTTESVAPSFPNLKLFKVDDVFGGWKPAQKKFFSDHGIFDRIQRSLAGMPGGKP